jgi:lipopolysaccharide export LptBFGC system permease protein LptF
MAENQGKFLSPFGILNRYILKEACLTFAYTVASFMFIFYLGAFLRQMEMGLPIWRILSYTPYILLINLQFALPLGFITGYILTFSRLSADREIQIIRVSGVPLQRIIIPHFIAALVITVCAFYLYQYTIPAMRSEFSKDLLSTYKEITPVTETYNQPSLQLKRNRVDVVSRQGSDNKGITIQRFDKEKLQSVTFAEKAQIIRSSPDSLTFDMEDVSQLIICETYIDHPTFKNLTMHIPIKGSEADTAAGNVYDLKTGSELRRMSKDPDLKPVQRRLAGIRYWYRIALACACFSFVLFAIPSGILSQQKSRTFGFILSILIVLFVFFPLLEGIRSYLKYNASAPAYLIMFPNVLFVLFGGYRLRKVLKQ